MDRSTKTSDNFLLLIPQRAVRWNSDKQEKVVLIKERSSNRVVNRLIDVFGRDRHFMIQLDDLGSAAWLAADGKKNVLEISRTLRSRFGDRIEPAEERVSNFFGQMVRNGFIRIQQQEKGRGPLE